MFHRDKMHRLDYATANTSRCIIPSFFSYEDLPTLFLHSPSENVMDRDTYVVKEGRSFELQCSTSRSDGDTVKLSHNGNVIQTGN